MLQEGIASVSQGYMDSKRKRVEELNKKYADLTQNKEDIESQIKKLHIWTSKTQKELLDMDKVHISKIEELNNRL